MTTLNVYQSKYSSFTGTDLATLDHDTLARGVVVTLHDYSTQDGYALVGHAEVLITLLPRVEIITKQVASLRKAVEDERLASGCRLLELNRQINSLLCIEGAAQEVTA